jgi:hypothetical protein
MRILTLHTAVASVLALGLGCSASAETNDRYDRNSHHSGSTPANLSAETIAARQHYFGLDNVDPKTGAIRSDRVILSWTGVSGFAAAFQGTVVLMDAYVARDGGVLIQGQPLGIWPSIRYIGSTPEEMAALKPELVLLGHTHFDHAGDLPAVVRANPGIVVAGAAEHCTDIQNAVRDVPFTCVSMFPANAPNGSLRHLSNRIVPGVEFTAVKQPHSSAPPNPTVDPPFGWNLPNCSADTDYPVEPNEPLAWGAPGVGPPSGAISVMWQIRVGQFAIAWQDTSGYIDQNVVNAFASLPPTDVRLASVVVAGRNALALNNAVLRPKLFLPLHHDACGYLIKKDLEGFIASLPASVRPTMLFMADPSDYLKPIVFDPTAKIWRKD